MRNVLLTLICCNFFFAKMPSTAQPLASLKWEKRALIVSLGDSDSHLLATLNKFRETNQCELNDRNIQIIIYTDYSNTEYATPEFIHKKQGFWLVGYDGSVKGFSDDQKLLTKLFSIIDQMPIRKTEIEKSKSSCE